MRKKYWRSSSVKTMLLFTFLQTVFRLSRKSKHTVVMLLFLSELMSSLDHQWSFTKPTKNIWVVPVVDIVFQSRDMSAMQHAEILQITNNVLRNSVAETEVHHLLLMRNALQAVNLNECKGVIRNSLTSLTAFIKNVNQWSAGQVRGERMAASRPQLRLLQKSGKQREVCFRN